MFTIKTDMTTNGRFIQEQSRSEYNLLERQEKSKSIFDYITKININKYFYKSISGNGYDRIFRPLAYEEHELDSCIRCGSLFNILNPHNGYLCNKCDVVFTDNSLI